jgi:GTPase SAR1 family protein
VFSVVVGPTSCGKTTLIQHVLNKENAKGEKEYNAFCIDLHLQSFPDQETLYSALLKQSIRMDLVTMFPAKIWSILKLAFNSFESSSSFPFFKLGFGAPQKITSSELKSTLTNMILKIPKWTSGVNNRPWVLFIDEDDCLSSILDMEVLMPS